MADVDHVALTEMERESDAGIGAIPEVGVGAESTSRTQREPKHSEGSVSLSESQYWHGREEGTPLTSGPHAAPHVEHEHSIPHPRTTELQATDSLALATIGTGVGAPHHGIS